MEELGHTLKLRAALRPVLNKTSTGQERPVGRRMVMAASTPVDAATEEPARGEPGQTPAFPAEMCLVGVPHVGGQPGHAVRVAPARGGRPGLGQRQEALEPQRALEDLGTDPDGVQAAPP